MVKHPHIYIPQELQEDEETIQFAKEFIENETQPSEKERLEALEQSMLEMILGGM